MTHTSSVLAIVRPFLPKVTVSTTNLKMTKPKCSAPFEVSRHGIYARVVLAVNIYGCGNLDGADPL